MNIYITAAEYDAISFAWSQISSEVEGSSDDGFVMEANSAIDLLASIQKKYREAKYKEDMFHDFKVMFKERFPEASPSTLGKLARKAIKLSNNGQNSERNQ